MKQLWFVEGNKVELREVDEPAPGPGELKIKIAYAALCATDVHMVTMGILGAKPPRPIGHEASGVIAEMGPGAEKSGLKVGDSVVLNPRRICGICEECKRGRPQYCLNAPPPAAFGEYALANTASAFKIPADTPGLMARYALTEPMVCCIRAMDLAGVKHGETVFLSGAGGIGTILLNMIVLSGAAQITVSDPVEGKRKNALDMGAQFVIDPLKENIVERAMEISGGEGFDHIFEASGVPAAAVHCPEIIAKCGKITYFAVFPPDYALPLNLYELYRREASIQTVFSTPGIFPRAIKLMPRTQMDKVIGKIMPLEQGVEAFALFEKSIYPKILLKCS
jgi:(R,R)-butanediol dehydrogenase/meso-butanediol dehydrogenase/diacetyl reductase